MAIPISMYLYFNIAYYSQSSAKKYIVEQLNSIISTKDTVLTKKISYDIGTYDFLMSLPYDVKCKEPTDAQGGDEAKRTIYYVAQINNQVIGITLRNIKKTNLLNSIFPKYEIVSVRKW